MTLVVTPFRPFHLGGSPSATAAIANYMEYEKTGKYCYLKECFAKLDFLVAEDPSRKIIATQASEALARKTIDVYQSVYIKLFIANSVDSIRRHARAEVDPYWVEQSLAFAEKIKEEGLDQDEAEAAGLRVLTPKEAKSANLTIIES